MFVLVFKSKYTRQEELMEYFNGHPWRATRTRIGVIGVNLTQILIKGNKIQFELAGFFELSEFELINRVKMTEK